ncbi:MAG: hypothetical protein ACOYJE_02720 [Bacteroidaceae bacterium]|jgi:hypothetical protein
MKKFFLFAFLTIFCTGLSLSAQNRRQRPERVYPSEDLIKQAQLTDDQVSALKQNEESYQATLKELLSSKKVDRDSIQARMQTARKARLEGVKKVLSSDQYVSYLEYEVLNPAAGGNFPARREAPRRNNDGGDFGQRGGGDGFGGGMDDF